jgi:hypothetical protein
MTEAYKNISIGLGLEIKHILPLLLKYIFQVFTEFQTICDVVRFNLHDEEDMAKD